MDLIMNQVVKSLGANTKNIKTITNTVFSALITFIISTLIYLAISTVSTHRQKRKQNQLDHQNLCKCPDVNHLGTKLYYRKLMKKYKYCNDPILGEKQCSDCERFYVNFVCWCDDRMTQLGYLKQKREKMIKAGETVENEKVLDRNCNKCNRRLDNFIN